MARLRATAAGPAVSQFLTALSDLVNLGQRGLTLLDGMEQSNGILPDLAIHDRPGQRLSAQSRAVPGPKMRPQPGRRQRAGARERLRARGWTAAVRRWQPGARRCRG